MIITFTPNPSIDSTLALNERLTRGSVQRLTTVTAVAGGKGINVAHALHLAKIETQAIFPAAARDPFVPLIDDIGFIYSKVHIPTNVRTNTTITEPDGTTTKLNGPGAALDAEHLHELEDTLISTLNDDVSWVVLAGSLPPGAPDDWYAQLTALIHKSHPRIKVAVDTSDTPLKELGNHLTLPGAAPNLIKPNGLELGQLVGIDGKELEEQSRSGDFEQIVKAATTLIDQGVEQVLVTLGDVGAVLVNNQGAWTCSTPKVSVVSTVGAGDCALAGFVMAHSQGKSIKECVLQAVAYGSAAAALPGTTIPYPDQVTTNGAMITKVV